MTLVMEVLAMIAANVAVRLKGVKPVERKGESVTKL
jgi:hypothetical protein